MYPGRGGPCGGSEVCRIHVGAQKHTPPRHLAGMNDCTRVGAHIAKGLCRWCMILSHTATRLCRWCMVISHTATGLCRWCMVISHTATGLCRCCMVVSHTATGLRRCCMVVSHTAARLCRCCMVVSHTATGHAIGRMQYAPTRVHVGRMLLRPYPGTRHSCTRPNSQASADAPAKFAGVRRRPGKLRWRP